jgi:23S rRNA (adenine-N6)-dimethyltransferase
VAGRRARGARHPRTHSQHFLRSDRLASELVRDAGVGAGDIVLDLGAGSGRLTAALARCADRVVAVEIDPRWAAHLRGRWPNVVVVEGDAAGTVLPTEPFRVVANLPFDRTTEILRRLLDDPRTPLVRADLVVQWDVALKRALPWPSTVNDVLWGAWYRFALVRRLPAAAFDPSPRVDAGVLSIERRTVSLVDEADWRAYRGFVGSGFRRGVRAVAPPSVLRRLRLAGAAPRDLDAYEWARLFDEAR